MPENSNPEALIVGGWRAVRATGELSREGVVERLEPKVMDLLFLLARRPGKAFTKDEIMSALWPGVIVGEDTLARAVSRLRKALADDPKSPAYIETLPKRGYRLIAEAAYDSEPDSAARSATAKIAAPRSLLPRVAVVVVVVALAAGTAALWRPEQVVQEDGGDRVLVERAGDFYFQYKRANNEAAIDLFERVLAERPDYVPALAGLANALLQKVIRWPDEPGATEYTKLADALKSGRTKSPASLQLLSRARVLAQRAVALAPGDAAAHKALGFVQSVAGEFELAIASYKRAIAIDRDAWGPLINIGDVLEIEGRAREALPYFERAYAAMTRVYDREAARVRPWYAELGVLVADRHRGQGDSAGAESWYRRVLVYAPLHPIATSHLAALLRHEGRGSAASELCVALKRRTREDCNT